MNCGLSGAYIAYILVVYLAPQIRFKYLEAQAKKRGETIKRYESFVTKSKKAATYGELADGPESAANKKADAVDLEDSRDRSSSQGLLANNFLDDVTADGDDDMDTSLLADMGKWLRVGRLEFNSRG